MPQDDELTPAMQAMKQEILSSIAGVAGSVATLQADVTRIDGAIGDMARKVDYLCKITLGVTDEVELKRAAR
jgi:hypothetical protein